MRLIGLCALLTALTGCGGGPRFAEVEGVVTLDGKPMADAEVQFIPDPAQGSNGPPTSAYTDKDGRYRVVAGDKSGAVVGRHRVCINDATIMMPGGGADPESGGPAENDGKPKKAAPRKARVPAVYSDATRTPFNAIEIQPGTQTIDFALKSNH